MEYYFSKKLHSSFDEAINEVTNALSKEGFGIVSTINMHDKFKEKLGVDFKKYTILGACNPAFAYKTVQNEDKIGTMLPCNVVVIEQGPNQIEVAAVNPTASMMAVENNVLGETALQVTNILKKVIEEL